jgi:hypothetical protein
MSFTFTQQGADSFTPNANPLNPTNWTSSLNTDSFASLQAVSGTCRVTATSIDCCGFYTGVATPLNGYAQVTIAAFDKTNADSPGFEFFLRSSNDCNNQYAPYMGSNGDGTCFGGIAIVVDGSETDFGTFDSLPFAVNDVWKAWIYGTTLYLSQNGTIVAQYTDTNNTFPSAGLLGIDISSLDALTTVELSSFSMGVVTSSSTPATSNWDAQDGPLFQFSGLSKLNQF